MYGRLTKVTLIQNYELESTFSPFLQNFHSKFHHLPFYRKGRVLWEREYWLTIYFGHGAQEICTSVTHWRKIFHLEVDHSTMATISKHWLLIRVKVEQEGDISQNWWRMCLKITDLWKYRKYAFCQVFLARWQDETIFALIIVRTTRRTGSRISNARGDRKLFVSIILKIFPHSRHRINQFDGGGFVNFYLEIYVCKIKISSKNSQKPERNRTVSQNRWRTSI